MRHFSGAACGAFLPLCCVGAGSAGAQTADIKTIVSVGGPPVVLNQNSQLNMAGVFMIGGRTRAAATQKGTSNATGVLQFRGAKSASAWAAGDQKFALLRPTGPAGNS